MVLRFKNIAIRKYDSTDRKLIEIFRSQVIDEGNDSLILEKYNPDSIEGETWMTFVNGSLASISVCEASHYTGDPTIAARICRYHILKKYRHCNARFRMLPYQVQWDKEKGFKVIYWTHDIKQKALNALYQRKKRMPGKECFFSDELYKSFKVRKDIVFRVNSKSDFLQYIYSKVLVPGYFWAPKANVVFTDSKEFGVLKENQGLLYLES